MQLLEVKSNIAKIEYNPAVNHILPSDFLLIEDTNQKLIAQVINISSAEKSDNNIADVRLILSIDKNDNLSYYNGYIPLKTSIVMYIHPDEIIELIKSADENIYLGNLSTHNDCFVKIPLSCIDDRIYIQSDRYDNVKTIIQNITAELISKQKKVIILDFNGHYSSASNTPRLKITDSFKLPLNIEAFNNILEYDTTDCPIEEKAVIQSIVLELREYIKTLDNKFLPFNLFKTVIDNELASNPIAGLKLLRNKLWLYAQEGIFAESKTQFEILNNILDNKNIVIIDASSLEEKWYKFTIQTIQELVNKPCYLVLSLNDIDTEKKTITGFYGKPNVVPIVSTSYDSKYRQILKSICKNQILFKPSKPINDEDAYSGYLNRMNSTEFILYGESELYIPLILELQQFTASTPEEVVQNDIKKEVDKLFTVSKAPVSKYNMQLRQAELKEKEEQAKIEEKVPEEITETEVPAENIITPAVDNEPAVENIIRPMSAVDPEPSAEDIIRPMSVIDNEPADENIIRPMSAVDNDTVYVEEKEDITETQLPIDDDFNDSDLDFLEERDEIQITLDDIKKPEKQEKDGPKYDIFSPMDSEDDLTVIDDNIASVTDNIDPIIETDKKSENIEFIDAKDTDEKAVDEAESTELIEETADNISAVSDTKILPDEKKDEIDDLFYEEEDNIEAIEIEEETKETEISDELIQEDETIEEIPDTEAEKPIEELTQEDELLEEIPDTEAEEPVEELTREEKQEDEPVEELQEVKAEEVEESDIIDEITQVEEQPEEEIKEEVPDKEESTVDVVNETEEIKTAEEEEPQEVSEEDDLSSIDDIINNIEEKANNEEPAEEKAENKPEENNNQNDIKQPSVEKEVPQRTSRPLPYYEADNDYETMPKTLPYKIGDKISHPKLGIGVIVDFMHFGDRIQFCRIDFENKGIRLLDPRTSQFEKI